MAEESPKIIWVPSWIPSPVSEGYEIRSMHGLLENRAGAAGKKKAGVGVAPRGAQAGNPKGRGKGSRKQGKEDGERIWGKSPYGWEAASVTQGDGGRVVGRDWVPAKPPRKPRKAKAKAGAGVQAGADFRAGAGQGGRGLAPSRAGAGVGPGSPGRLIVSADWAPDKTWDWQGADPGARGWAEPAGAAQAQLGGAEYVPPEIEAMAEQVMAAYEMRVSGMHLITTKADKGGAIWRIETDKGPRSLKLLHRPPARSLYSVGLQEYVAGRGGRVPKLIPSRHRLPFHVIDGRMWIVTEWIEPLTPAPKVGLEGAQQLCYGLGEFHKKSSGYVPPAGAEKASRLYKWPGTYQKVRTKIGWFRHLAQAYPEMKASPTLLSMVDRFEAQAARAVEALERSPYGKLAALGEPHFGVVHLD